MSLFVVFNESVLENFWLTNSQKKYCIIKSNILFENPGKVFNCIQNTARLGLMQAWQGGPLNVTKSNQNTFYKNED